MTAYYNEIDPFAAAWLRELIKAGHIAPGEVDERSIADVMPSDLARFTQCHFFAGIGVWSYALRQSGWGDDRPVWTGSCPCQPFSSAGKGKGFKDERHLWPEFYRLISQCRPTVCFGEQVASKDGLTWVNLVQADMEGTGYAFGAIDTCSAGFGAPHIRQRLYWVADAEHQQHQGRVSGCAEKLGEDGGWQAGKLAGCCEAIWLANADNAGRQLFADAEPAGICRKTPTEGEQVQQLGSDCPSVCGLANAESSRHEASSKECGEQPAERKTDAPSTHCGNDRHVQPGPTNGFWRDADWLLCRDGKWRAVEPGTFPLAHGAPARVGRLRGYGNAINAEQAKAFIEAFMEVN